MKPVCLTPLATTRRLWTLLVLNIAVSGPSVFGLTAPAAATLDHEITKLIAEHKMAGLAVGVVQDGALSYVGTFGFQDRKIGVPISRESVFHTASISKLFTTTAILQLQEQGRLSLDDDLGKYLPAFAGRGITLQMLLTHTAGFKDRVKPAHSLSAAGVDDYLLQVKAARTAFAPGTGWEYSDTSFNLLGAVISRVTGKEYTDSLRETLLVPLGMTGSSFYLPDIPATRVAQPHAGVFAAKRRAEHPYDRVFAPSSGLQTNLEDLAKFAASILRRRTASGQPVLSDRSYEAMWRPYRTTAWPGIETGLGWQLSRQQGQLVAQHSGSDAGYKSRLTLYPEENLAIIILANAEDVPRTELNDLIYQAVKTPRTP